MIARKKRCPICGIEYLARTDEATLNFAPHCRVDVVEQLQYLKNKTTNSADEAEELRDAAIDFVESVQKLLIAISETEHQDIEQLMIDYGVRL